MFSFDVRSSYKGSVKKILGWGGCSSMEASMKLGLIWDTDAHNTTISERICVNASCLMLLPFSWHCHHGQVCKGRLVLTAAHLRSESF